MKQLLLLIAVSAMSTMASAQYCSIDGFANDELRLQSYQRSQAATSFNISCDTGYSILFNSQNLVSTDGMSYVSNGTYKLRTKLNLRGASGNAWGVPLQQSAAQRQKFIVSVQLVDNPFNGVPAGTYRDRISVDINF
ncbi:hypothetical protein [Acinetobacter schindleri]|jgi:hypothetical protein|uniref:Spore coat protein U domain-containing protein n=1 Tax=Acinetobacter schindleri NIPH 900 TaxID=1217675 RepID=N8WNK6_9GAMM|nr:hypothetical protein [Acinetobacter schindleri]AWD70517.1 hypothetical protein C0119_09810 [Acinetobacter schindleri]ENV13677.1 hypothetical protein F965_00775 [Acinetobacter schindleri NIPH 900]MBB4835167.1 hypothetical protein [Acinetobacter schindleri]WBX37578.1 hypothetical protein MYA84_12980 [Acinetobacter schindleri]